MKRSKQLLVLLVLLVFSYGFSQPYVDIANFNYQRFAANYKNNLAFNTTEIYNLNLLLPKQFKNGNALLLRINAETIHSERASSSATASSNLSSVSVAVGYQWLSKSQNWKTTLFAIPKVASDFEKPLLDKDWQFGGVFIEEYKYNEKLQVRIGLFANREAFGGFFVPLLGLDWKVTDRIYCYGTLPASYKIAYNAVRNKIYTGLNFKSQTRSFAISAGSNKEYVRFDEITLKGFVDYFLFKNVLVNAEIGYSLGKNPLQYDATSQQLSYTNAIYTTLKNSAVFSVGVAYRIRKDLGRQTN